MVKENNTRSFLLDFLKGIAIIAVILYHSGLFTYGYLGVEIFLVVGGYLTTKGHPAFSINARRRR
jgi:peptidoglycan/LPS O-acetylase OafA/YrhL